MHPHRAEDVPLHRIGVLELVDHRVRRALAQPRRQRLATRSTQRAPHQLQHVVVVEQAALVLVIGDPCDQRRQQLRGDGLVEGDRGIRGPQHDRRVMRQLGDSLEQIVDRLADRIDHRDPARRVAQRIARGSALLAAVEHAPDLGQPLRHPAPLAERCLDDVALVLRTEPLLQPLDDDRHVVGIEPPAYTRIAPCTRAVQQHVPQPIHRAPGLEERREQLAIRRHACEPLAEQRAERRVERDLIGDLGLLEHPLRGERILDEHAMTEPVDGVDRRVVECGDRRA